MYPATSIFIAVGQLAIAILVLFSYPLQVHPCRNCLDKVFGSSNVVKPTVEGDEEDDDHGHSEMSAMKHFLLTMVIVVSGFTISYMVDDLQIGVYLLLGIIIIITGIDLGSSFVICGSNRVDDDIVHSSWPVFLEGRLNG